MKRKHNPLVSLAAMLLLAAILVLACTGCAADTEAATPSRFRIEEAARGAFIRTYTITDTETGVQYMFVEGHNCGGLTKLEE